MKNLKTLLTSSLISFSLIAGNANSQGYDFDGIIKYDKNGITIRQKAFVGQGFTLVCHRLYLDGAAYETDSKCEHESIDQYTHRFHVESKRCNMFVVKSAPYTYNIIDRCNNKKRKKLSIRNGRGGGASNR